MLAVFEDGIRTYCRGTGRDRQEAERWVWDPDRRSPFSFNVICEVFGLEPNAARSALRRLQPTSERVRPNAGPGRKTLSLARRRVAKAPRIWCGSDTMGDVSSRVA
jgi:hypothetical protein